MFYAFSYTPDADYSEKSPHVIDMPLTAGIIHQVDVLFQSGCNHKIFVQMFDGNYQIWPSNRGEKLRGDATLVSFREFYELVPGNSKLKAHIWSTLGSDYKEIIIQIGILPKAILQPLSFDELLQAASKIE